MALCTGPVFSSLLENGVVGSVELPNRGRMIVPSICAYNNLRHLKAKLERRLFRGLDLSYGSSSWRQGGRRLISHVTNYKTANPSESETVPVWLWLVDFLLRGTKSVFQFLYEQPGQLQHIEWPTVNTVVTMAVLTLVVVTCLIVLLATVDSTMSYVLASLLRRLP